jgi:hypothetical protein
VDSGGLRYGAMESALRPPLLTATRAFAECQIQARLTNRSGQNIITSIRGSRCQVADIKSESRPASLDMSLLKTTFRLAKLNVLDSAPSAICCSVACALRHELDFRSHVATGFCL